MIEDIYNWLTVAGVPQVGTPQQFNLWKDLMLEELEEMTQAFELMDREEMLDAYIDLLWVNTNLPFMFGFTLEEIQNKIDRVSYSNWSKFCTTEEEADNTINAYRTGTHPSKPNEIIECYWEKVGAYYIIKRKDGKVLKGLSYQQP